MRQNVFLYLIYVISRISHWSASVSTSQIDSIIDDWVNTDDASEYCSFEHYIYTALPVRPKTYFTFSDADVSLTLEFLVTEWVI